ncbi:hypothetical protein KY326_03040 [Candidatus Woesearchaeota archaeon]|nr:hypothetical protein [Candidatus Woesearchaeota archaeon]
MVRELTLSQINKQIETEKKSNGRSDLEEKRLGTVLFDRDLNGIRKRLNEIPLYDLTDRNTRHIIPVGTTRICNLVPKLESGEVDPEFPERKLHGYVYAENGNVFYFALAKTWVDPRKDEEGRTVLKSFGPENEVNGGMKLLWYPGEYQFNPLGFCLDRTTYNTRYKLFFISKEMEDLAEISKKFDGT